MLLLQINHRSWVTGRVPDQVKYSARLTSCAS